MKKEVTARANKYLQEHPLVEKIYTTSDGFMFETKQHAIQHGATLEDKEVITITRELKVADGVAKPSKDEAPKDEAPKDEATKDEAPKDEAPKDEAPKDEAPKDEAPKDATSDEASKVEAPKGKASSAKKKTGKK